MDKNYITNAWNQISLVLNPRKLNTTLFLFNLIQVDCVAQDLLMLQEHYNF